jgi:hypothetical protein
VRVPIKTAAELSDPELERRWATRRLDRQDGVLRQVWRAFIRRGGPVPVETIAAAGRGTGREAMRAALARLDADDLIVVRDGVVRLAYPFSGDPTAFTVVLPGGRERFACCAIDALGIAPMLGRSIGIRSRCHHCGTPLVFGASPSGPMPGAGGIMAWIGRRAAGERRVCTGL